MVSCHLLRAAILTTLPRSQAAWKSPSCNFQPTVAHDLEIVIQILGQADVSFAIRSGGHMPAPGFANIDEGVLIDMSKLTSLQYDAANDAVTVGSGNRWGDLYAFLDPFEVTVVGGRVNDVGVAELTLGYEWLSTVITTEKCISCSSQGLRRFVISFGPSRISL